MGGDLLLTAEQQGALRTRLSYQWAAVAAYAGFLLLLLLAVVQGMVPVKAGWGLAAWMILGQLGFLGLVRSGRTMRRADPSMMLLQSGFALTTIVVAYTVSGPQRGCVLILAVQVLAYGMFSLKPREALGLGAFATVLVGTAIGSKALRDPHAFVPGEALVRIVVVAIALLSVSAFVHYVATLRERMLLQKQRLMDTLSQAQHLAKTDALTGLHNRLHMQELLEQECARQDRHGGAFTVVIIDLDWFKDVNDQHGHHVGDSVLQGFARVLTQELRTTDAVARWGGEEFLLLFPDTKMEVAQVGLRRLRERLMSTPLTPHHTALRVNFSSGLAEHRTDESLEATLERADRGLYRAKEAGRGRDWVGH